ncbi:MAG: hypothetical protein GXO62_03405 [Epsilonproteobacteria bacterium]|nr:hypothetical protein [Campylobacterota bacterium]
MHIFKILTALLLIGCSVKNQPAKPNQTSFSNIKPFEEAKTTAPPPPMVLESPYKQISPFDGKFITLSAKDAPLSYFLYSVAKTANLNLVIGKDVNINQTLTLNLQDAPLKEALDTLMDITGYYYKIKGTILYIKKYDTKIFKIPYLRSTSSYKSTLGGDVIGSNTQNSTDNTNGGGVKGDYSLNYETKDKDNDFYAQLESNIKLLLSKSGKYTLNKFSGTLMVYDTKENLKKIERFLNHLKKATSKGVLIEAKILEVSLNKSHSLGINWNKVFSSVAGGSASMTQTLGLSDAIAGTLQYNTESFNMLIQAIAQNGKVKTLSNPRIRVLNSQSAIILSGNILPFWEKKVDYTTVTNGSTTSTVPEVTYTRRDVLDGISLGVTPIIKDDNTIILNIVPVSSSIVDVITYKDDNQIVGIAPKLNIKEAGTVIRAKDNDLIVIGGLIGNKKQKTKTKVPFFGDLPIIGGFFSRTEENNEKRELVILLRLRIVNNE